MDKNIYIGIYLLVAGLIAAAIIYDYTKKEVEITSIDGICLHGTASGKIYLGMLYTTTKYAWDVVIVGTTEPTKGRWQYYIERDRDKYVVAFMSDKKLETNVTYDIDDLEYKGIDIFFVKSGMSIDSIKGHRIKGIVPEDIKGTIYAGYLDLDSSPEVVFVGTTEPINGTWEYEFETFERGEDTTIYVLISELDYDLGKTYNLDDMDETYKRSDASSLPEPDSPDFRFLLVAIFIIFAIMSYKKK